MFKKIAAMAFGALLVTGCGGNDQTDQADRMSDLNIVGGVKVSAADQITRSTVALVTPTGKSFCTGSLIAPKLVLTASHCLVDYSKTDKLTVAFGTVAKSGSFVQANLRIASSFVTHEGYNTAAMEALSPTSAPNDIALIQLSESAPKGYTPVTVLGASDVVNTGETLTLAGFGLTYYVFGSSGVLRKVDTKIKALMPSVKELEFGEMAYKSACMGDSGGPAFVARNNKLVLVGVTSRGSARCDSTGIYTDVRYFTDWISQNAAN